MNKTIENVLTNKYWGMAGLAFLLMLIVITIRQGNPFAMMFKNEAEFMHDKGIKLSALVDADIIDMDDDLITTNTDEKTIPVIEKGILYNTTKGDAVV